MMDRRLLKAAVRGNVTLLHELLKQDPTILDGKMLDCVANGNNLHVQIAAAQLHLRYNDQEILIAEPELVVPDFIPKENPLHIAAQFGHVHFMREILSRKPHLAQELNWEGQSPLHLASAKGHAEVVELLLENDADACLDRDFKGRTPLHLAAMKGRVELLELLLGAECAAAYVLTKEGEPILHLCSNHNQFESLKRLLKLVKDDEFLNLRDTDDNTILHLVAAKSKTEIIQLVLRNTRVNMINNVNMYKCTALDLLVQAPEGSSSKKSKWILHQYGAKRGRDFERVQDTPTPKSSWEAQNNWLSEIESTIMLVAILIATVTFQAMTNPPGGVWQDFYPPREASFGENETLYREWRLNITSGRHSPGTAIMSTLYPVSYIIFSISNQIGFIASVNIILLLISGFNVQHRIVLWVLTIALWFAMGSLLVSYGVASIVVTDPQNISSLDPTLNSSITIIVSTGLILLLVVAHLGRLVASCVKKYLFLKCKMLRSSTSGSV